MQIKRRGKTNHLFCARNKNPFPTNHSHCYYYSTVVIIENSQTAWLKLPIVQYSDKNYETALVPPLLVSDRVWRRDMRVIGWASCKICVPMRVCSLCSLSALARARMIQPRQRACSGVSSCDSPLMYNTCATELFQSHRGSWPWLSWVALEGCCTSACVSVFMSSCACVC